MELEAYKLPRRRHSQAGLLAALVLFLLACGGGTNNTNAILDAGGDHDASGDASERDGATHDPANELPGDGDGDEVPVFTGSAHEACRRYVEARCDRIRDCEGSYMGHNVCLAMGEQLCPDLYNSPGSLRSAALLASCAKKWKKHSCAQIKFESPDGCTPPGTRADGEPCLFHSQCASGACSSGAGLSKNCGVCVALSREGEPCASSSAFCERDLWCHSGTCEKIFPGAAEPLLLVPLNGECGRASSCELPSACQPDTSSSTGKRCLPLPSAAGTPCAEIWLNGILQESCDPSAAYCEDISHLCQAAPELGDACSIGTPCVEGTRCVSRKCVKALELGQRCRLHDDCMPNLRCTLLTPGSDTICTLKRHEGESCDNLGHVCDPGTKCENALCVARESIGLFETACAP